MDEMMAVHPGAPEVQYVMEPYMTQSTMLSTMLTLSLGQYVDWETGECGFDSEGFIEILEFCMEMPSDATSASGESTPAMVSEGASAAGLHDGGGLPGVSDVRGDVRRRDSLQGLTLRGAAGNVAALSGQQAVHQLELPEQGRGHGASCAPC